MVLRFFQSRKFSAAARIFCKVLIGSNICIVFAQEGNYKFENYGNDSSLLTGNVTATVSDLAMAYYNPSKLAFLENRNLLISVKAYQWKKLTIKNNLNESRNLSDNQFNGIPSMLASEFKIKSIPKHKFAYSFISRYRTDNSLKFASGISENGDFTPIEDDIVSIIDIDTQRKLKEEWFGLTWSYKIGDKFSVGVSSFVSIYEFKESGEFLISGKDEDDKVAIIDQKINYKQNSYGMFLKLGMSYVSDNFELGANVNLPHIKFFDDSSIFVQELSSGLEGDDKFRSYTNNDLESNRKTAFGVSLGAGIPIGRNRKSKIHLNVDWYSKVNEYSRIVLPPELIDEEIEQSQFNEEARSVVNYGLGTNLFISDKVKLILSFSSDYNAYISSVNILDQINKNRVESNLFGDFWHFGLGTDFTNKWGNLYTGLVYSESSGEIVSNDNAGEDILGNSKYERLRIIIGVDIPLVKQKVEDKLKNFNEKKSN